MAQQPPHPGAAQAANVNPKDVAPSNMNARQQQAVADVVAHDAAKGANVYVSDFCPDFSMPVSACSHPHAGFGDADGLGRAQPGTPQTRFARVKMPSTASRRRMPYP